jgi:hypothetical protein
MAAETKATFETTIDVSDATHRRGDVVLQKWVDKNTLVNVGDLLVGTGEITTKNNIAVANVTVLPVNESAAGCPLVVNLNSAVPLHLAYEPLKASHIDGSTLVDSAASLATSTGIPKAEVIDYAITNCIVGGTGINVTNPKINGSGDPTASHTATISISTVNTAQIANAAVNTAKIANYAITTEKFATAAVAPKAVSAYSSVYTSGSAYATLLQIGSQTSSTGNFSFVLDYNAAHSFVLIKVVRTWTPSVESYTQENWFPNVLLPASGDLTVQEGLTLPYLGATSTGRLLIPAVQVSSDGSIVNMSLQFFNSTDYKWQNLTGGTATVSLWTMSYSGQ